MIISYPEFVSPLKESVYFIDSFMRYSQFKSPVTIGWLEIKDLLLLALVKKMKEKKDERKLKIDSIIMDSHYS